MSQTTEVPIKRVVLTDPSQLPPHYSTTPGGTLFGTTPGGTRIIYDRAFLLQCRNSPQSRTPPSNLAKIPGVTCASEAEEMTVSTESNTPRIVNGYDQNQKMGEEQFNIDM